MTYVRTIRTVRPTTTARRFRPHVLRRDGILEPPPDVERHDRYRSAIAAGWRPLG